MRPVIICKKLWIVIFLSICGYLLGRLGWEYTITNQTTQKHLTTSLHLNSDSNLDVKSTNRSINLSWRRHRTQLDPPLLDNSTDDTTKLISVILNNSWTMPSPTSDYHRYIIQWFNWEQLTMATNNLITLAWFVKPWRAHIIEPFTRNSKFLGIPYPGKDMYTLSSLFDYQSFNQMLGKHKILPILKYKHFFKHANRQVILIHILYNDFDLTRFGNEKGSRSEVLTLLRKQDIHYADCSHTKYMKRISSRFLQTINRNTQLMPAFKISHICCVNGSHQTYREEMAEKCGINKDGDVTVVFTDWKGVSPKKGFRVFAPEVTGVHLPHPSIDVYPYSQSVLSNASTMLHSLTNGKDFIGIHLRTEKLGQQNFKIKGFFEQCLKLMQSAQSKILAENNYNLTYIYFADTGRYGSRSCIRHCLSIKVIERTFEKYGIKVTHYNPYKFGGLSDSGFVATVEQEALSRAKILVLVGGGSFQSQVATRYKHYHQNPTSIHRICDAEFAKWRLAAH